MTFTLLDHQKPIIQDGLNILKKHNRVYLALHAGAGKTLIALTIAKLCNADVHVVAPRVLHKNWRDEVKKHSILNGISLTHTTYESLDTVPDNAIVIFDECHARLGSKNKTKRLKKYLRLLKSQPDIKRIYLSATPFSKPIQLFPILQAEKIYTDWFSYTGEFCDRRRTPFGFDVDGASNLPKLRKSLTEEHEFFIISSYKEEREVVQEVYVSPIHTEGMAVFDGITSSQIHDFLKKPTSLIPFEEYSEVRRKTGEAKLAPLAHYINGLSSEARIIFMHHTDLAEQLAAQIPKAATINGKNTNKINDKALDDFKAGDVLNLVLSLTSASEGLNLTEANHAIFGELPWNAYQIYQAKKRIDRFGQTRDVKITYFVQEASIDHHIARIISQKTFNIQDFIGKAFV